jgi:zinc transporter
VKGLPLSNTPNGFLVVMGLSLVSAACAYAVIRFLGIRSRRD